MSAEGRLRYAFERFEVLEQERRIIVEGTAAVVGARAFDVLLDLIRHRDRVVSKNELLERVWPGLVVEENNLQVQISGLRKLLGADTITTVPGRGYRFTESTRDDAQFAAATADPVERETDALGPETAALAPPLVRAGNLPATMPALCGRAADIAEVCALLDAHRAVSIVASSGVGKTRLAQAVARACAKRYADGAWWVELAPVSDGELVAAEIARALGCPLAPGRSPLSTVIDVLRTRSMLLLLDNCEHLLKPVADLVEAILQGAPDVQVLLTSLEPLRMAEEQIFRLNPLTLPDGNGLDSARQSGAVELFVDRVRAVDPRFVLNADNADKVCAICETLDGIPLALELAAARVVLLGLDGLSARLGERFRVLTGGSRFVLRRHQTLRAAFDFSHALLTPVEQRCFRRLGVFNGSFSVKCAQDIVADDLVDRWELLDVLGALVEKSIVLAEHGDEPRLRLLETARAYALEKLGDARETDRLLTLHAQAMSEVFATHHDTYWATPDVARLERFAPELDNLRTALDWALVHEPETAIALTGNAGLLWLHLELHPEGARRCEAALARVGDATPALAHGRLWLALSLMVAFPQPGRSRAAATRAAALLRQTQDTASLGLALLMMISRAKTPDAEQLAALAEIESLHRPDAPPAVRAQRANARARIAMSSGLHAEARRHFAEAAELLGSAGATLWQQGSQWGMADNAMLMGEVDHAVVALRDHADRLEARRIKGIYLALALGTLATAHLLHADPAAARAALAAAAPLIIRYDIGVRYASTAALLAAHERRWPDAAKLLGFGEAAAVGHAVEVRDPAEVVAEAKAVALLVANAAPDDIAAWRDAGAALTTDAAYLLALTGV